MSGEDDDEFGPAGDDPVPGSDESQGGFGDGESDGFGDAASGFGEGGDSDADDVFGEDFATAFEGGGTTDFDEAEYSADISRIDIGIEGLDEMIQGGVPERSLMVVVGAAGTGKTTFGLQFLTRALEQDESTIFISLEETRDDLLAAATERGWGYEDYIAQNQLAIVDLDPIEMANSLTSLRDDLPDLISEFGATRVVLDSVSLLEMMYQNQAKRRTEVYDFTRSLKDAGVTMLVTSEASEDTAYASRYGIVEYLTDAVFVLQYIRSESRETRLAVEIQKVRNANHSRETKPYEITSDGISVYQQANIF